jgi:hypothetical protein
VVADLEEEQYNNDLLRERVQQRESKRCALRQGVQLTTTGVRTRQIRSCGCRRRRREQRVRGACRRHSAFVCNWVQRAEVALEAPELEKTLQADPRADGGEGVFAIRTTSGPAPPAGTCGPRSAG